ncbi:uncharacterized protein Dwil_GK27985 [Drosophila willistoni]|uniref:Uncharacterized protein n=1 Tax=Drosophila willistoni TaxID=7260 RepID=A0A0Q9WS72_DROWI|nr:uncharacterized protein Dwil_GK27985 [Drosophila willistoni]
MHLKFEPESKGIGPDVFKLNDPKGKPPLPPRREQHQQQQQQQQELSSFGPLHEKRLSSAALSRHKLKMSLKRGGPPPASSSGAAMIMTTSLSGVSLDKQVMRCNG